MESPREAALCAADVQAGREHCEYCFDALCAHFTGADLQEPAFQQAYCALFVSWQRASKTAGKAPRMRGCLGTLEPRWLHSALKDFGLRSAVCDRRFSPIQWEEVPLLSCTVSLLRYFEPGDNWQDWDIGTHGLVIKFVDPVDNCQRSATYLPHIPVEQGFSKKKTIDHLIRKAGYSLHISEELRDSIELTRYQSTMLTMGYEEYFQSKQDLLEQELSNGSLTHGLSNGKCVGE
eukprot:evm.model.scf_135.3 EVM.evm.TU.scf_135.3   scf_135:24584-27099(+)